MSEQKTKPIPEQEGIPTLPAVNAIKQQVIKKSLIEAGILTPSQGNQAASESKEEAPSSVVDAVIANSLQLSAWLDTYGRACQTTMTKHIPLQKIQAIMFRGNYKTDQASEQ